MDADEALRLAIEASLENAEAPAPAPEVVPAPKAQVAASEIDDFDDELARAIRESMGEEAASSLLVPTVADAAAAPSPAGGGAPALARTPSAIGSASAAGSLQRCMSDDGTGRDGGTCVADEERRADLEYDHWLAHSMQTDRMYSDPEFVPAASSLGSGKSTTTMHVRSGPTAPVEVREVDVVWLRPKEIGHRARGEPEWALSHRQPSGSDVAQGTEGDCWLVSAMAVAAEGDGHIAHALRSAKAEGCGAVQIRLCLGGLWTVVTVDDLIPCDALSRRPVFASGRGQQLWPCFIEKGERTRCAVARRVRARAASSSASPPSAVR